MKILDAISILFLLLLVSALPAVPAAAQPNHAVIKLAIDNNYPPYVFQDSEGRVQGILIDQWRLWEQKTGIRVEIHAKDWGKALSGMKGGEFDVIDTIFKTEERSGWLDFTGPYARLEVPIFFDKQISGITDATSLKGFVVAAKSGDNVVDILKRSGVDKLMLFDSYEEIVQAARDHKATVFVIDKPPALYFLNKFGILNDFQQSAPLYVGEFHRAVNKGNSKLLATVQDGFRLITPEELKKIETKWYGLSLGNNFPTAPILAGVGVLCLVVLILFAWNRALKSSVEKRTAELKISEEILRTNEAFVKTLINAIPAPIFYKDKDGRYLGFNTSYEEFYGLSQGELIGKSVFEIAPKELAEIYHEKDLELFLHSGSQVYESRVKNSRGVIRDVIFHKAAFTDSGGHVCGLIGVILDITERIEKERALLEKEQKFKAFFEQGYYFAGLLDKDGILTDVNDTALQFSGVGKNDVIGKPFWETPWWAHSPGLQEKLRQAVQRAAEGTLVTFEATHPAPDGTLHYIDFSLRPVKDQSGTVVFLVPEGRDITDRKKAGEERLNLERQLLHAQKLESLGILSGGIAHDFNNLLQAMLGNLELALMRLPHDTPVRKNINHAIKAGRHAAQLTSMMLAYSGKGLFVIKPLNLTELVEENATMLEAAIHKSITLEQQLDHTLPIIRADAGQLQQVIMNIITNAAEAIGDRRGTIALSTGVKDFDSATLNSSRLEEKQAAGRYVWLEVRDTGCGMEEETLSKLFDPFFTTKFTGRGLGMSAVLGIIRAHKGAFLVESVPGIGTTIKVLFPTAGEQPVGPAPVNESKPITEELIGRSGKVLVVDDEDMIRAVSTAMLKELGFETLAAASGEEALALFREMGDSIDVVLLDQVMPGMDGVTVFKELRTLRPDIKVLLASGFSQQEVSERFSGLGLYGFLPKPYTLKNLTAELSQVLMGEPHDRQIVPAPHDGRCKSD